MTATRDRPAAATLLNAISEAFEQAAGDVTLASQTVCRHISRAFGDPVVLRLADGAGNLDPVGVAAPTRSLASAIIRTFQDAPVPDVVRDAVLGGAPAMITTADHPDSGSAAMLASQERVGYRCSLLAPLRARGRTIGMLSVLCTAHVDDHHDDDLRFLAEVADRCALDIDNTRLLDMLTHEMGERSLAERRHAALLRHTSDMVALVSGAGKVLDITPAVKTVLGWEPEELLRGSLFDVIDLADRDRIAQVFAAVAAQPGPTPTGELRVRDRDGVTRWLEVTGNNLLDDPAVAAIVITARDVTERHYAAALLSAENDVLQQIAAAAPLAEIFHAICRLIERRLGVPAATIWISERDGRLELASAPSIPGASVSGPDRWTLNTAGSAHVGRRDVVVSDVATSPEWEGWRDLAAQFGIAASWGRSIFDRDGRSYGAVSVLIPEHRRPSDHEDQVITLAANLAGMAIARERSSRAMAHAAHHDALTGLANRTMFLDRLGRVLQRARDDDDVSVLFIDLDDFKIVNDTAGHAVGDVLLREAAMRLAQVVRPMDLIARLGGDEFAVLCDGLTPDAVRAVADRVLNALSEPFVLGERVFHVSASAGIASGNATTAPQHLLRDADTAMYQAKRDGRGRHAVFTPAAREATVRRVALSQDLRRAIETGELSVDYQPVVSLATGRLTGLEALARWRSPEHGAVSPPEFIDIAEQTGIIGALGESVLVQAVERAVAWRKAGLIDDDVTMAVNVSAQQLADPTFTCMVDAVLAEYGLPHSALCLELTESVVMDDLETAHTSLEKLGELGVVLAIDDFGTGHSSLARLRTLSVSVLKLDRMFIIDLDEDDASVEFVAGVVHLAHALGKRLVAEGVERATQLQVIERLGVDAAQGYHLGRPQPADALERYLRTLGPTGD